MEPSRREDFGAQLLLFGRTASSRRSVSRRRFLPLQSVNVSSLPPTARLRIVQLPHSSSAVALTLRLACRRQAFVWFDAFSQHVIAPSSVATAADLGVEQGLLPCWN